MLEKRRRVTGFVVLVLLSSAQAISITPKTKPTKEEMVEATNFVALKPDVDSSAIGTAAIAGLALSSMLFFGRGDPSFTASSLARDMRGTHAPKPQIPPIDINALGTDSNNNDDNSDSEGEVLLTARELKDKLATNSDSRIPEKEPDETVVVQKEQKVIKVVPNRCGSEKLLDHLPYSDKTKLVPEGHTMMRGYPSTTGPVDVLVAPGRQVFSDGSMSPNHLIFSENFNSHDKLPPIPLHEMIEAKKPQPEPEVFEQPAPRHWKLVNELCDEARKTTTVADVKKQQATNKINCVGCQQPWHDCSLPDCRDLREAQPEGFTIDSDKKSQKGSGNNPKWVDNPMGLPKWSKK